RLEGQSQTISMGGAAAIAAAGQVSVTVGIGDSQQQAAEPIQERFAGVCPGEGPPGWGAPDAMPGGNDAISNVMFNSRVANLTDGLEALAQLAGHPISSR